MPENIATAWDCREAGAGYEAAWEQTLADYRAQHPELAAELERRLANELPADWSERAAAAIAEIGKNDKALATRKDSQVAINGFAPILPEMVGGSADLTGSNLTMHDASVPVTREDAAGNYIYYGIIRT